MIGATASVHTYTFLTGTYVVTYVVAFAGLLWRRGRGALVAAAVSVVLLVALFVVGPRLADSASPLALLVLGLLPAAPGALLAIAHDRRILAGFAAIAVGAAPQVVLTTLGVASGDAFLEYRQASTRVADLGVPLGIGLFHGSLLLVALLLVLLAGLAARHVVVDRDRARVDRRLGAAVDQRLVGCQPGALPALAQRVRHAASRRRSWSAPGSSPSCRCGGCGWPAPASSS